MKTNRNVAWQDMGGGPTQPVRSPLSPKTFDIDTGERTDTEMGLRWTADSVPQTARFACGHGQTRIWPNSSRRHLMQRYALIRLVLVAHTRAFGCACVRDFWHARFREPLSAESVIRARRWATTSRATRPFHPIFADWEQRDSTRAEGLAEPAAQSEAV
jgi:hypothetical protein